MIAKTYLAKITVRIGEHENDVALLLVANSDTQADQILEEAACAYYGNGDEAREDGGYYANNGEIHVSAKSFQEIGLATFSEMKKHLRVKRAENVETPELETVAKDLKNVATVVTNALKKRNVALQKTDVLDALSAALGFVNWQVLSAKLKGSGTVSVADDRLLVLPSEDGPGWNLYATLPANVDAKKVNTMMDAWLAKQRKEDAQKPEGEDYTESDVLAYLTTLGAKPFQEILKGPSWD